VVRTSSRGTFARFPHMIETLESTPPSPTTGAGAQNPNVRQSPETDAARRRARQNIREYELIWLLQQRLRAVSWPHWRLRCIQPLLSHGMGLVRPGSLSRGDTSVCHARFMCSAPAFCAWRRLPLICLKLLVGVCVRDGLAASVCAYIELLLLSLSFVLGVGAPSLYLAGCMFKAVRCGSLSFSWFVVASAACVYETGLLLVCACRISAASVEPLPRGSRAVAFPRSLHEF